MGNLCNLNASVNYPNPQDLTQKFNDDEAVWRAFECKRWFRNLLGPAFPISETALDALDWIEAEREARPVRAIGFSLS